MNNWDSVNIINFEVILTIVKQGKRISGTDITEIYNSVFNKNLNPTNCSSCINQRYKQLKQSYDNFVEELKKQEEKAKALEVLDELMTPTLDEFEPYIPTEDEVLMDKEEMENNPKKGRKKNKL
jgi:hypothetical protein